MQLHEWATLTPSGPVALGGPRPAQTSGTAALPSPVSPCVLVVDDDPVAVRLARYTLQPAGFDVVAVTGGGAVEAALERARPVAVVLDLVLPDMSGLDVCRAIRASSAVPIVVVTVLSSHQQRLRCLRAGADDVLTKPYDPEELALRVQAVVRRAQGSAPSAAPAYAFRGLVVDPLGQAVTLHGRPLTLTATERLLLATLTRQPGVVHLTEALLREVFGPHATTNVATLYLQVSRLRRKLGDQRGQPTYVHTVARQGYLVPAPDADGAGGSVPPPPAPRRQARGRLG